MQSNIITAAKPISTALKPENRLNAAPSFVTSTNDKKAFVSVNTFPMQWSKINIFEKPAAKNISKTFPTNKISRLYFI